ncbi:MAG: hypothetical protein CSA44_01355 [Gammaproteobacteria bacterium]|nr:MAG: hypothetical protein CSA44_01355 [Gammaproteobacteria bacterium]
MPNMLFSNYCIKVHKFGNLLLLDKITPYTIGQLLAAYEHKVLVQSSIWGINAFDQFGVELGKQLCHKILAEHKGELSAEVIKKSFEM